MWQVYCFCASVRACSGRCMAVGGRSRAHLCGSARMLRSQSTASTNVRIPMSAGPYHGSSGIGVGFWRVPNVHRKHARAMNVNSACVGTGLHQRSSRTTPMTTNASSSRLTSGCMVAGNSRARQGKPRVDVLFVVRAVQRSLGQHEVLELDDALDDATVCMCVWSFVFVVVGLVFVVGIPLDASAQPVGSR